MLGTKARPFALARVRRVRLSRSWHFVANSCSDKFSVSWVFSWVESSNEIPLSRHGLRTSCGKPDSGAQRWKSAKKSTNERFAWGISKTRHCAVPFSSGSPNAWSKTRSKSCRDAKGMLASSRRRVSTWSCACPFRRPMMYDSSDWRSGKRDELPEILFSTAGLNGRSSPWAPSYGSGSAILMYF